MSERDLHEALARVVEVTGLHRPLSGSELCPQCQVPSPCPTMVILVGSR